MTVLLRHARTRKSTPPVDRATHRRIFGDLWEFLEELSAPPVRSSGILRRIFGVCLISRTGVRDLRFFRKTGAFGKPQFLVGFGYLG